jgi:predicted SAM-dependent methyltransferase
VTIRDYRNRFAPFATKQNVLRALNPILRLASSKASVQARLAAALREHDIEHMDLGGWMPVEGYLTLHLSSVEPYGMPLSPKTTMRQFFDEETKLPGLNPRVLDGPAVTLNFDIKDGLPLHDGSLRGVNLSHVLEHFDIEAGRGLLRECRRVLQPGGALRVSCPDLRKYAQAYLSRDAAFFERVGAPGFCNYPNLPTPGAIFAGKAYDASNGHQWFYDADTVRELLKEAGFSETRERTLHESALPRISEIEPAYREIESFYIEAVR